MQFPHEPELLERVKDGSAAKMLLRPEDLRAEMGQAVKTGIVAGHVLSVLYAISESPWRIPEPSLGKAINATAQFGYREKYADGSRMPRGDTDVRKCFDGMRAVAHLWAALRLHREYPIGPHEDLLRTEQGLHTLLRLARAVQSWALQWRPRRTNSHTPLIGQSPWLVPDSMQPLSPSWAHRPDWLLKTVAAYKRRSR